LAQVSIYRGGQVVEVKVIILSKKRRWTGDIKGRRGMVREGGERGKRETVFLECGREMQRSGVGWGSGDK